MDANTKSKNDKTTKYKIQNTVEYGCSSENGGHLPPQRDRRIHLLFLSSHQMHPTSSKCNHKSANPSPKILFAIDIKYKDNHFSCGPGLSEKVSRRAILDRLPENSFAKLLRTPEMK